MLPALGVVVIRVVTSLSGVTQRDQGRVYWTPAQPQFALIGVISGGRTKKLPLTHRLWSFTVRHRLYSNSLASPMCSGLSSLSYSPPEVSLRSPKQSAPVPLVAKQKLPTPAHVERWSRLHRTPLGDLENHFSSPPSTTPASANAEVCQRRPRSVRARASNRTSGLLSLRPAEGITLMSLR